MTDDDFDLSLSPVRKPVAPKQGRRANAAGAFAAADNENENFTNSLKARRRKSDDIFDDEDELQNSISTGRRKMGTGPPPQGRRTGGWADENSRIKSAFPTAAASTRQLRDDGDDDIPVIPDLDEVQDEDMVLQVADAPSVAVNRVATYKELDNDLLKHAAFATLDGDIDLKLLTRGMAPEVAIKELDELWTWDVLFAQVGGQLQKEWYPDEDHETEQSKDNPGDSPDKKKSYGAERPYTAFNRFPV